MHTDTVESLKSQIYDKDGVPPHMQRLVFSRQLLENGRRVSEYGMEADSTVDLYLGIVGGAPKEKKKGGAEEGNKDDPSLYSSLVV